MQIRLFCSYSRKDEFLRQDLETHLSLLKRQSLVTWYDRLYSCGAALQQDLQKIEIDLIQNHLTLAESLESLLLNLALPTLGYSLTI